MKNSTVEESQHVAEGTFQATFSRSYSFKYNLDTLETLKRLWMSYEWAYNKK